MQKKHIQILDLLTIDQLITYCSECKVQINHPEQNLLLMSQDRQ